MVEPIFGDERQKIARGWKSTHQWFEMHSLSVPFLWRMKERWRWDVCSAIFDTCQVANAVGLRASKRQ